MTDRREVLEAFLDVAEQHIEAAERHDDPSRKFIRAALALQTLIAAGTDREDRSRFSILARRASASLSDASRGVTELAEGGGE